MIDLVAVCAVADFVAILEIGWCRCSPPLMRSRVCAVARAIASFVFCMCVLSLALQRLLCTCSSSTREVKCCILLLWCLWALLRRPVPQAAHEVCECRTGCFVGM